MTRRMSIVIGLCAAFGCGSGRTSEPVPLADVSLDTFVGTWRSVTPSTEFIRLTVHSKSSQMGVLGARLTFSGVFWEGNGRIEGDSLVADMALAHATTPTAVLIAHAREAPTLRVKLGSTTGEPLVLAFVREH